MEIFFYPIWYKSFDPKFDVSAFRESIFSLSAALPLGPIKVLGHTIEPDLGFNSPHKVHAYNLLTWYTMVI